MMVLKKLTMNIHLIGLSRLSKIDQRKLQKPKKKLKRLSLNMLKGLQSKLKNMNSLSIRSYDYIMVLICVWMFDFSGPQDIPLVYCLFYVIFVPLRWIYYRYKKWHYYLLDFCYYANTISLVTLLLYPKNEKLFMVCFSFAEGPLAWAIIVWRCSLVFNSIDKITSVLIHLLPGLVFFTIRWWNPTTFADMHPEGTARRVSWPYVENKSYLWTWLVFVPLIVYTLWQILYFLIVDVLRRQRLLRDPEVMTSYRELSKKAQKANNMWWRLSSLLGDQNRLFMYIAFQALFTVATMALTVPLFLSYHLHVIFQVLKVSAAVWNGGSFVLEVMPRQVIQKQKKKTEMRPLQAPLDDSPPLQQASVS
ncbi:glycerophosphocholine acyltransferase 1 isoform X2 [Silene latifolia]|uniref:glycerophosphocholine acyltransferase 1 isoform X2 n=1 Tax=Silene latifolia TaxID=37657 RepID=UPI003D78A292